MVKQTVLIRGLKTLFLRWMKKIILRKKSKRRAVKMEKIYFLAAFNQLHLFSKLPLNKTIIQPLGGDKQNLRTPDIAGVASELRKRSNSAWNIPLLSITASRSLFQFLAYTSISEVLNLYGFSASLFFSCGRYLKIVVSSIVFSVINFSSNRG